MHDTGRTATITVHTRHGDTRVPVLPGAKLRDLLDEAGLPVRADCGGQALCGLCLVQLAESAEIPPTQGELNRLKPEQLARGIRLSCQIEVRPGMHVTLRNPARTTGWRPLREDEYCPLPIPAKPKSSGARFGLAIDLGTTHIRLTLWDLHLGRRLAGRTGLNPQTAHGADVLTRLMVADHSPKLASRLSMLVVNAVREALAGMTQEAGIQPGEIGRVDVVGNTAMLALLAGKNHHLLMDPAQWTGMIDCQPGNTHFFSHAWQLAEGAKIQFLPPMGGFVGSDLLAGVVATRLMEGPPGSLLIDFGTNSEMALWDGELLRVTSTAGGPAFEGSGISCGMPAEDGAIYRVGVSDPGFDLAVVGNGPARGICGSGLVDAMAGLRRTGMLDKVGRLKDAGQAGIALTRTEPPVTLNAADIDVFQRAKAAIGAGVSWLCGEAGIRPGELQRVCVCGAFGRLLDVANAQEIGLLPAVPSGRIELNANTALAGCEILLLAADSLQLQTAVQSRAQVFNMAEDMVFESLFVQHLYVQPIQD